MFGLASIVCFAIAFILYAAHATTSVPWTPMGFTILGLLFVAIHGVWPWYAWRRPGP